MSQDAVDRVAEIDLQVVDARAVAMIRISKHFRP